MTISRAMRRAASGLLVPGYMEDIVDPLAPTYFWPLQGDLVASHGGKNLTDVGTATTTAAGPGADPGDLSRDSPAMSLTNQTINANENTTGFSYGGWFRVDTLASDQGVMGNWTPDGSMLVLFGTTWRVYIGSSFTSFAHGVTAGTWYHWMVCSGGGSTIVYRNGAVVTTWATSAALGSALQFRIGSYNINNAAWRPDMAAAWCGWWVNRKLTAGEVAGLALAA